MLSHDRAKYYYKSLHFNHYESGGTCEQRVLVLRARFDRILEELSIKDFDSQRAYVEKLQQIFTALPKRFTEEKKKECHALRRYLNGVQHSTFEADESQYKLSLKRLCELIKLCSEEGIPQELKQIWKNKESKEIKHKKDVSLHKSVKENSLIEKKELPFVLCVDCSVIENSEDKRTHFNEALRNLLSRIADDELDVNLRLILIGKKKIKYIVTRTGEASIYNYEKICEDIIVNAIENSCDYLSSRLKYYIDNGYKFYKPSGLAVFMLSSEVADLLSNNQATLPLETHNDIKVLPVGLTSGMDLEPLNNLSHKNSAVVLKENKFEDFFNWLHESLQVICN